MFLETIASIKHLRSLFNIITVKFRKINRGGDKGWSACGKLRVPCFLRVKVGIVEIEETLDKKIPHVYYDRIDLQIVV